MTVYCDIGDDCPTCKALEDVALERDSQDVKWGSQRHLGPEEWLRILVEEVGEVAHAINERDAENYRAELVQVAAVAVAAIECLDHSGDPKP